MKTTKAIIKGLVIGAALILAVSLVSCVTVVDTKTLPDGTIVTVSTRKTDMQSIANGVEVAEKITPILEKLGELYKSHTVEPPPPAELPIK